MAYHPFSETESKAPAELAVCIVFLILTYLSVGARCYVRIYIIKSFGWDDALMVVALIFFNVWAISIIIIAYEYGGGTKVDVIGTAMDWILVSEIFYVITAMTVKLSLGIFFLRIVIKPWQRAMVYVVMVLIALTSIFFFFFLIFLCGNPKDYLIRYVYDQCAPRHVQTALAYLSAALGAAADWTYALIPVQIVVQANMDLRSKLSVLFILSLGTAGCVCSTVRLKYIEGLVSPTDFFWNAATIAIWSGIECGAGITAGSLATLRPLFKRWFATVRSLASGSLNSSGRRNRRNKANPDGGAESSSGAGAGGSSSSGGRGNRGGAGKPNTNSQRSFASKSLPSKSSSSGQASDNNSSNNTTGRPLTAWPASGCWEKLDERDHSIERQPASSSSLDLICATRTAAPSEDLELSTLSRETSADTAYHHHQQQLVEQPHPRSPSLPPPPLPQPPPQLRTTPLDAIRPLSVIAERDRGSHNNNNNNNNNTNTNNLWEWPTTTTAAAALEDGNDDDDDGDDDDDDCNDDGSKYEDSPTVPPATTGGRWEWPESHERRWQQQRQRRRQRREGVYAFPPPPSSSAVAAAVEWGWERGLRQEQRYEDVDLELGGSRRFTIDAEGRILDMGMGPTGGRG